MFFKSVALNHYVNPRAILHQRGNCCLSATSSIWKLVLGKLRTGVLSHESDGQVTGDGTLASFIASEIL